MKTCLFDKKESQKIMFRRTLFIVAERFIVVQQNLKQMMIE
jgi:hypothetical protein